MKARSPNDAPEADVDTLDLNLAEICYIIVAARSFDAPRSKQGRKQST